MMAKPVLLDMCNSKQMTRISKRFKLAGWIPVIVISYHAPMAPGIMKQSGLGEYVLDIDTLVERGRLLLESVDNLRKLIEVKMRRLLTCIDDDVKSLVVG